jgi:N6-adenosine-specific RNA methylase IME4
MSYELIVADPPWEYNDKKTGGSHKSGAVQQYHTMTAAQIRALPVYHVAAKNAFCLLWCTKPLLDVGLDVLRGWGFKYKTAIMWDKQNYGMGHYMRGSWEIVLVGVKGIPSPWRFQKIDIVTSKARKHSMKPEEFMVAIEQVVKGPKLELFARSLRHGWDCWGNEVESTFSFDEALMRGCA